MRLAVSGLVLLAVLLPTAAEAAPKPHHGNPHATPAASPAGTSGKPAKPHHPHPHATPTPTPTPVQTPVATPTAAPTTAPTPAAAPVHAARPTKHYVRRVAPAAAAVAPASRPSVKPAAPRPVHRPVAPPQPSSLTTAITHVDQLAPQLKRNASLPLGLLAAVFLFLAVQGRIDRRDPKLRVTEASSTDELTFSLPRGLPQTVARPLGRGTIRLPAH